MKKLMTVALALGLVFALTAPALARGGSGRGAMGGGGAMGAGPGSGMTVEQREAFRADQRARNQAACPYAGTGAAVQDRTRFRTQTQPPAAAPGATTRQQ